MYDRISNPYRLIRMQQRYHAAKATRLQQTLLATINTNCRYKCRFTSWIILNYNYARFYCEYCKYNLILTNLNPPSFKKNDRVL